MKFYYDTEFSSLKSSSELISIGMVAETGDTFYCELAPLPTRCSDFVKENVLPQLEGGAAIVEKTELIGRLADWFSQWPDPVELISDSTWDIFALRKAVVGKGKHDVGSLTLATTSGESRTISLRITPLLHAGKQAVFNLAVNAKRQEGFCEHHALSDALTLQAGMDAVREWVGSQK